MALDRPLPRIEATDLDRVRGLLEPVAAAHGVELYAVEWATGNVGRILRVVIDRLPADDGTAGAAVTLEDCARVSRDASTVLDATECVSGAYHLEVSSPGLDRPLTRERDFRRHVGRVLKAKLRTPAADGQRVLRGTLLEVRPTELRMAVDGKEHLVSFADIELCRLVIDFGRPEEPIRAKGGKRTKASRRREPAKPGPKAAVRDAAALAPPGPSHPPSSRRREGRS